MQVQNISQISTLPEGFVYLESIDDTILQEIRYAGYHNFVGRPIDGYEAHRCVVTKKVGLALAKVQAQLQPQNLTLKVYEGYRPLRAASHFVRWALDPNDHLMKAEFYPAVEKDKIFELGYVAIRSQHTRGCAVDLTLVPLPVPEQVVYQPGDQVIDGRLPKGQRFNDNSIEMGTGFDCLDVKAHTLNSDVSEVAQKNRAMLTGLMASYGFANYRKEWWHFYLADEPFPDTYFDFPIR